MRVLDTATILAAMAQVTPRERRPRPEAERVVVTPPRAARARAYHRPTPSDRGPGDDERGPRQSSLVVVPQGVIPVMVPSSRLALARAPLCG